MSWSARLRRHGGAQALAAKRQAQIVMLSRASSNGTSEKIRLEARDTLKWLHENEKRALTADEVRFWQEQAER